MQQLIGGVLAQNTAPSGGGIIGFLPFILMFVVFYFLLIRPQQKQAKQHREYLNSLRVGDEVVTSSGIFGKIEDVGDREVRLEIARDVRIRVLKSQIAGPQSGGAPGEARKS